MGKFHGFLTVLFFYLFRIFPIKNNKIYIINYYRKGYGDNGKYIAEALLRSNYRYDIVWYIEGNYTFPRGIRAINGSTNLGKIKSIYEQATAKVWISNCRIGSSVRKRKGQFYVQTWHGDIPFKKIEFDAIGRISDGYLMMGLHDSQLADLFICGNEFMRMLYKRAFKYYGEIAICGVPRCDVLYTKDNNAIRSIKRSIGLTDTDKLMLFVPTFRNEEMHGASLDRYSDVHFWTEILTAAAARFGGQWKGAIRLHPNLSNRTDEISLPSNVLNLTDYPDVQELLLISDCCISDYSSALFDFAITKKPGFVYADDLNAYEEERGFYFSISEIPFPSASSVEGLAKNIMDFSVEVYSKKHDYFYGSLLKIHQEGNASKYVSDLIERICNR